MKTLLFVLQLLATSCALSGSCLAQCRGQSSTRVFPLSSKRWYVVLPVGDSAATLVKTKRLRQGRTEYVDIVNVFLPADFVRQTLRQTQDLQLLNGLFGRERLLVTMAVLPLPQSGHVRWVPIDLDSIATRQVRWQTVANDCYARLFNYKAVAVPGVRDEDRHRRMDFYPVIKRGTQYLTPAHQVLTDYFVVHPRATWFPTLADKVTINCRAQPFTPADLARLAAQRSTPVSPTPSPFAPQWELTDKLLLRQVDGGVYTFWSVPHGSAHGGVYESGVVEFQFQPTVGVVSGKYPAYFGLPATSDLEPFFSVLEIERLVGK
jgi:hypothetical protein